MSSLSVFRLSLALVIIRAWQLLSPISQVLEGLYKSGKARAIGVSNYNTAHLQELLAAAEVKPMVNQVRNLFDLAPLAGASLVWYWVHCCRACQQLLRGLIVRCR
jgi:aryl-alcohol dehydrogenase-like predicted oxidoreductase